MPLYEYVCGCGNREERQRRVAERNTPAVCSACFGTMALALSLPADRFPGADRWAKVQKVRP